MICEHSLNSSALFLGAGVTFGRSVLKKDLYFRGRSNIGTD